MSYPPPPGLKSSHTPSSSSTAQPHSSLPPRPPPPAGPPPSFKPAFTATPSFSSGAPGTRGYNGASSNGVGQPTSSYSGFTGFQPRSVTVANPAFQTHSPIVSAPPAPPTGFSAPQTTYSNGAFQPQPQQYQQPPQAAFYPPSVEDTYSQASAPQIRNPFPLPGQEPTGGFGRGRGVGRGGGYQDGGLDPEMEAQIAQWQSAYAGKDADSSGGRGAGRGGGGIRFGGGGEGPNSASGANAGPLGGRPDIQGTAMSSSDMASAASSDTGVAAVVNSADGKQKTVVRSGGGQTWQDPTLLEWDPAHFRLFVGNLAGEVTDESLLKAFSKFNSVQKARVVRDKRTTKSKGFGFVSFSDGEEYFQAARDMQGKYIGSHPVLLRKSTTEIRPVVPGHKKGGKGGKGGGRGGNGGKTGAGVQKKQSKTKGGLRVLG
ncbi:MAG: hypothetical protein M1830_009004 [Pleopsidium flavum]|nr:MAG: hypothetical protein M1830_009004 [Pleopsidium flavum]